MKIELNLAIRPSLRERYGVHWAVLLVVVSVGVCSWLVSHGLRDYRAYRSVQKQVSVQENALENLEKRANELREELEQPQFRKTAMETQMVNGLIERKAVSFPEVTEVVSRLIPSDVRLTTLGLSVDAEGPAVRMSVVGKSQTAVESVLKALQDSPDFSDAEIQSENPELKESGGEGVSMVLAAHYVGRKNRT
jgi:hypothetical protein